MVERSEIELEESKQESNRSRVRIWVTYIAAVYVFAGSSILICSLWIDQVDDKKLSIAKDIFFTVLPIATGIITYWFASRKPKEINKD